MNTNTNFLRRTIDEKLLLIKYESNAILSIGTTKVIPQLLTIVKMHFELS